NKEVDLNCDCIGIVFPVYMWGVPRIVKEFIKKINTEKYVFAVATYGVISGSTLLQVKKLLRNQKTKLCAGFRINMPDNAIMINDAFPLEKQNRMFHNEREKIKEISCAIKERKIGLVEGNFFLINWFTTGFLHKVFTKRIPSSDQSFWTNEKCNSCNTCKKICPLSNIGMINGRPEWLHKCQLCMRCIQWCPQEAIQYKNKSIHRRRYRNPCVKISDFIINKE
ncbi:MAG: EFR1 family ferrodoxin, partial [Bacillota bacterium]|nr:EFR1 family ferrodoxin [Bacillota bacterium]